MEKLKSYKQVIVESDDVGRFLKDDTSVISDSIYESFFEKPFQGEERTLKDLYAVSKTSDKYKGLKLKEISKIETDIQIIQAIDEWVEKKNVRDYTFLKRIGQGSMISAKLYSSKNTHWGGMATVDLMNGIGKHVIYDYSETIEGEAIEGFMKIEYNDDMLAIYQQYDNHTVGKYHIYVKL